MFAGANLPLLDFLCLLFLLWLFLVLVLPSASVVVAVSVRVLLLPPHKALRGITGLGPVSSADCMLLALQANNNGHQTEEWKGNVEKIAYC